jgi:hypothetical protein
MLTKLTQAAYFTSLNIDYQLGIDVKKRMNETCLATCNAGNCDLFCLFAFLNKILCKLVDN